MSCSFNFKSGGKNKCNTIDQYLPSLQLMNKERERKEEIEKREERKRMKECNPRMYDCSFFERGARKNGQTLQQKLEKNRIFFQKVKCSKTYSNFSDLCESKRHSKTGKFDFKEGDRKFGWQGQHAVPLTVTTMQQYPWGKSQFQPVEAQKVFPLFRENHFWRIPSNVLIVKWVDGILCPPVRTGILQCDTINPYTSRNLDGYNNQLPWHITKAFPWLTGHDWGVGALADAGVDGKALCLVLEKNSVIWRRPEIKNRNHFVTGTNFVRRCSWILVSPRKCLELAVIAHTQFSVNYFFLGELTFSLSYSEYYSVITRIFLLSASLSLLGVGPNKIKV